MYSTQVRAFDATTEEAVRPMAAYAAETIATSPLYAYSLEMVDGLVEDLETRALIGQATGVLVGTEDGTTEAALDRLRNLALRSGESMRTVAEWVINDRPTGGNGSGLPAGSAEEVFGRRPDDLGPYRGVPEP